jgi:hypothetical protein
MVVKKATRGKKAQSRMSGFDRKIRLAENR